MKQENIETLKKKALEENLGKERSIKKRKKRRKSLKEEKLAVKLAT